MYSLPATRFRNAVLSSMARGFPPVVQPSPCTKLKSLARTLSTNATSPRTTASSIFFSSVKTSVAELDSSEAVRRGLNVIRRRLSSTPPDLAVNSIRPSSLVRQFVGEQFSWESLAAHSHHDVLFAVHHVGH